MPLKKDQKIEIIKEFGSDIKDTGSTEVQIALLTTRILELTEHFKIHKNDHAGRRGLLKLVGQRRRLLKYLKMINLEGYRAILKRLNLRK
ncbi:MAG: 30S ribosomal protein S15 [Spirochaetia bacterium]|jgi:small subunit ribosomal protein S15|nr:30S ribosomal protein S15 [Spirochaetia bacterium]